MSIVTTMIGSVSAGGGGSVPAIATSISYPVTGQGVSSLGSPNILNYVAWYKIEIPSGPVNVNFNTIGSNGGNNLDTMLGVYNFAGSRLGYDDDSGGNGWSDLTLNALDAGTYYIGVGLFPIDYNPSDFSASGSNSNSDINLIIMNISAV